MSAHSIVFLVTEDWYFLSHRLPMARAARDAGFSVTVATRVSNGRAAIEAEGFTLAPIGFDRRGKNPLREIGTILEIFRLYRRLRPDVVHHVALKPILYGGAAALLARVPAAVSAFAGMGYFFTSPSGAARLGSKLLLRLFRLFLRGHGRHLVVQNHDDRDMALDLGLIAPERLHLVPGSGVDTARFAPMPEGPPPLAAALVGRMLWDKGVGEAVEAVRGLRAKGIALELWLVGEPDPANPRSIDPAALHAWQAEGLVRWLGRCDDIPAIWAKAAIAVLPSYREGMPMALLEAAACGRPLVATDVPGCRELVRDGENGLLVPVRDAGALGSALERLALEPELRQRLGRTARADVEGRFSAAAVGRAMVDIYRSLLPSSR